MRKNLIIVILTIVLIVIGYFKFSEDEVEYDKMSGDIVTNNTFDYKTYSLFKMGETVLRINHKDGKTHYFNQGVWIPVQDIEMLQKMAIERQKYEERVKKETQQRDLLNEFD